MMKSQVEGNSEEILSSSATKSAQPKKSTRNTNAKHALLATSSSSTSSPASKRQRKNEDGLLCPISLALPIDPVMADDGKIYEKKSIEDYFKSQGENEEILSPFTRKPITTRLLPSPQIKITIETPIDDGAITGSAADEWKKRMQEKEGVDDVLQKAEEGDVESMLLVASCFEWGGNGFQQDHKEAFTWCEKACVAGSVPGMAKMGDFYLAGVGVEKNIGMGLMCLGMAEGRGSDYAACILGVYMAKGLYNVPVNKVEARKLLEKSLSGTCPYQDMGHTLKQKAQGLLDQLVNETP